MARASPTNQRMILDAALAEYHAVYGLAQYRLNALDRRIPLIGGLLTAFLGSVPVLPEPTQLLALIAVPISLIWLVRTTINHARSFEDALRRIEHQEHLINNRLGVDVMGFQRSHPSKGSTVGGRTGRESVIAVMIAAGSLLMVCWIMSTQVISDPRMTGGMSLMYAGIAMMLFRPFLAWRTYDYTAQGRSQNNK